MPSATGTQDDSQPDHGGMSQMMARLFTNQIKMACTQHLNSRCVLLPAPWVLGAKHVFESSTKMFKPHFIYDCFYQANQTVGPGTGPGTGPTASRETRFTSRLNIDDTIDRITGALHHLKSTAEAWLQAQHNTAPSAGQTGAKGGAFSVPGTKGGACELLEKESEAPIITKLQYTVKKTNLTICVECQDCRDAPLKFAAKLFPREDDKITVDFRLTKGDGIEFKRTFTNMCDLLFDKDSITAATERQP